MKLQEIKKIFLKNKNDLEEHLFGNGICGGSPLCQFKTIELKDCGDFEYSSLNWIFQDDENKIYKLSAEYSSYQDIDFEYAIDELVEVVPVKKTITVYEEIK